MDILKHFALKSEPRPVQVDALNWLIENTDKKYIFCELAVGSGKSVVGVTFANYINSLSGSYKASYIITPQKILQQQYEKSFDDKSLASLYGKSNYTCASHNTSCDIGSVIKPRCQNCPHHAATMRAKNTDHVVMNYALALSNFSAVDKFEKRSLMIFDECHQLESLLTEYNNITVSEFSCSQYKIPLCRSKDAKEVYDWIRQVYLAKLQEHLQALDEECEPILESQKKVTAVELVKLKQLAVLEEQVSSIINFISRGFEDITESYILTGDDKSIKFKHIYGAENFHEILAPKGEKFMFLSATIFDHEEMCRNLNIPISEACFLSMDSDFHVDNRPVVYNPIMKMSYGWERSPDKKQMIAAIKTILTQHGEESGIIHTGNFQIAKWLVEELRNVKHEIFHHNPGSGDKRDAIIQAYIKCKKPSLLISPSITEGLDLVEDAGRFVIFAKVSFGTLADAWIKHRMEQSNNWYMLTALTDVFQGCGRIVRNHDDYGVVYILDQSWSYLFSRVKQHIPKWWLDAYHEI
jgi:ATP-dependent DNA helicase DinG